MPGTLLDFYNTMIDELAKKKRAESNSAALAPEYAQAERDNAERMLLPVQSMVLNSGIPRLLTPKAAAGGADDAMYELKQYMLEHRRKMLSRGR